MPRAPGSGKRHSGAAGQRDTRHENGLVGPANPKRLNGKRSQANFDAAGQAGASRAAADNASGQARLPPTSPPRKHATGVAATAQPILNAVSKHHSTDSVLVHSADSSSTVRNTPEVSLPDDTSSESDGSNMGTTQGDAGHRQIDVNAMKNVEVHRDQGPLELATTVLKNLPMQDTLAILIILMHVPAVSLIAVYAIFTILTFVPPVTTSSGMNINFAEILDGTSNTPAPVTLLTMDVLFFFFWLFLWQPLQELMQDFAKPVIAITLGGGTGSQDGTSRGLTTTFFWVMLHHLLRGTQSHWARLARHIPDNWPVPAAFHEPWKLHDEHYETKGVMGWIRSLLAVHILTQGIIRAIKDWYLRRERENKDGKDGGDPEAGKPHTGNTDGAGDASANTETEASAQQAPVPATVSKKRRKQSAQIRLRQPLWAALASTKIVVVKEYELSNQTREQAGSNATDVHNLGNAPFERQERQIWISYVGSDEVCFNTSLFPDDELDEEEQTGREGEAIPTSTKKSERPFFVRVNNAFWQPTRMFPLEAPGGETEDEEQGTRWTGDIYGLRPTSKYVIEFVDRRTEQVLFSTSIRTVHEPQREAEAGSSAVANGQRSLQPDSPTTTMKTSIAAAEARLTEEKNKLKSARKDWKTRINNLRKDIEATDNQLASAGNHDEKYRQKVRQQDTQKAQAERDTATLAEQLKNFDTAPELTERKKKVERLYTAEKKLYDAEKKQFEEFKSTLDKGVRGKELEHSNLVSRVNKIRTRINKVETELANISDANNRGLDEAERRRQERAHWQEQANSIEANYRERLNHIRSTNGGKLEQIGAMEAQLNSLMSGSGMHMDIGDYQQQQPGVWNPNPAAPPHIPSNWASSGDMMPSLPAVSGPSPWQPPPTAPAFEPRGFKVRGRSSSMLSDVSGFTQSSDGDSPMHDVQAAWRQFGTGPLGAKDGSSGDGSVPTSPV